MSERKSVIAFGELLMRLSPKGFDRFVQADTFDVRYTGAEANSAVSVVNYGMDAYAVSKVPDNEIGQACINYLRRFGVNTDYIARGGERLGTFYLETGAAQRASKIIYDRSHSAMRESNPDDYDWETICAGKHWFHFSGTAPALGENVRRVLEDGLKAAKKHRVMVSCDLNYRAKLWSPEEANRVMTRLMEHVDVLIGNEEDAEKVFGVKAEGSDVTKGALVTESYKQVAAQLADKLGLKYVATTLRESISASANGWGGLLYDGKEHYLSRRYEINPIIDRVGGGDSFTGGLIYSMLSGWDSQRCVEFAVAASCLKHSIVGDFNLASVEEVLALLGGDASGRVQR
ncbi:MAG: 2-dehydro-3-deoxygluconokinase [Armatimonadetes bacterium RBG_16_58_9]|nr:MAG: 2-dehydro-3-deoxygluconokinase [Armatimonadetes bacterium RBG_16_58_9]